MGGESFANLFYLLNGLLKFSMITIIMCYGKFFWNRYLFIATWYSVVEGDKEAFFLMLQEIIVNPLYNLFQRFICVVLINR